jgi:uncharacterized protein (TIGR03382 family)
MTLLALLLLAATPVAALDIGVAPGTTKVFPDSPMPPDRAARVQAARNEWEGFQVVIRDEAGLDGVDCTLSDLCRLDGTCIAADHARLYREHYVEVTQPSPFGMTNHEREPGPYPDPLVPLRDPYADGDVPAGAPFDLQPGETGVIFADLYVPSGTAPGAYLGWLRVSAAGEEPVEVPVRLEVWEFDIPAQPTIGTSFRFPFASNLRPFHGGPADGTEPDLATIEYRYHLALHEHRIDPTTVEHPVQFEFDEDGDLLPVDWTAFDAGLGPWMDGTRFPDGVAVTRHNVNLFRPGYGQGSMSEEEWVQAARALAEHMEAMGWWERTWVYGKDEPWMNSPESSFGKIAHDMDLLHQASESWRGKALVTGPYDERIDGSIGIWCPVTPMYEDWFYAWDPQPGWDTYTERLELGEELWFYVCNHNSPPYAGYDTDSRTGHEPRIVKWGAWYERATGFLYYRTYRWEENDPWHVLLDTDPEDELVARNGDGTLLFPGDHDGTAAGLGSPEWLSIDGPVVTFRLKQIRDGFEDWEMFRLAADLGADAFTRAQVERAYTRFGYPPIVESCDNEQLYCPDGPEPWTLDDAVLLDAREQVARKILHLLHPDRYPDPEATLLEEDRCGGCSTSGAVAWGPVLLAAVLWGRRRRRSL